MPYWVTATGSYKPFNDNEFHYGKTYRTSVTGGIDTREVDNYREGINLRTINDIFNSTQLKVTFTDGNGDLTSKPNGELSHEATFVIPGQAPSFVQFTNNNLFADHISGFEGYYLSGSTRLPRTVQYLVNSAKIVEGSLSSSAVFPFYLNGGPQNEAEAIVELLPVPNRLPTNEPVRQLSRGVYAELGVSAPGSEKLYGLQSINQMVPRYPTTVVDAFLEQGSQYIIVTSSVGEVIKVVTYKPGATLGPAFQPVNRPWLDEDPGAYLPKLVGADDLLLASASFSGSTTPFCNFGNDVFTTELQTRDMKSSTAGFDYYGPNASVYGTNSRAFGNRLRGS